MTAEQVVATEEWIRDKAQLSNVRSDEVETLSLHGSYQEKIVTLGDSLLNFKRLKSLDLSRNAIVSLEGLECLQELEELSLYFNNIQTLKEISSLRRLIHLTELDLRLNPVTHTEENYRQDVIHLLPNLLKLDLRPVRAAERNPAKFDFISQERYGTLEVDEREESQQMENVFSYDTDEQNYVNQAQMCKWDGASNSQSDLRLVRVAERNPAKFDFISQEQYGTIEVDKREESQQMEKVFSYDTDEQNYVNRAQMCKWDGASNNQSDLRPVRATEKNPTEFDFISPEQYETSEVDKREESQQIKKVFSFDTDEQDYMNRGLMCKWDGASNNQGDLRLVRAAERNPAKFDFISQERYGTIEVDKREESQKMKKVFSYDTDEQNYVNQAQMCKWDGASNNQNDLRPVCAAERNPAKFDCISQEQYEISEADKKEESQQVKKVFSYDTDDQDYVNRAQVYKLDGASNNQSDVESNTKYMSIDEDDSTSIQRSRMLSTSQMLHYETSSAHHLVDRQQLLSPSDSLTSLHTTCSKKSFTDRKETKHLRIGQNWIQPSEDDYKIYQSPDHSSFCPVGRNVCNRSREDLRASFSEEISIINSKLSRSIPEDDRAHCLQSRIPSTTQVPHQEISSCDQQNRESTSFTKHINSEIIENKNPERRSKLSRANMGYFDYRLEARKTTSSNSLQPSYNGKATLEKLPEEDECGDYHPRIPLGLRSGSSTNISTHLQNLLDLVDRHWSGSNSLHRNQRFLNSAQELLSSALDSMAISKIQNLEEKVQVLMEENRCLLTRTASSLESAEFLHIKHQLTQKEDDLESLNGKFEKLFEENNKLHSQLKSLELASCAGHQRNKELHRENERLSLEAEYLHQQYEDYIKLQDTVSMLQESHRAIMSSNNYLKELLNASSSHQRADMSNLGSQHTEPWSKLSTSGISDQPSLFKYSHHRNRDIV